MNWLPLAIDEELRKIPLNAFGTEQSGLRILQITVQRMRRSTVDIDLGKHWERHAIIEAAKIPDFLFVAWLLASELIAGEAEDDKSLILVFFVNRFQSGILRREPAFAGDIDNQQHLAAKIAEIFVLPVNRLCRKVINCHFPIMTRQDRQARNRFTSTSYLRIL